MEQVTTPVAPTPPPALPAAGAGALAAAVALGVAELGAGITGGRSLVVAVGDWVINHAPNGMVEFGKRNFGTDDKAVLVTTIVVLSLVFGAVLGLAARRHPVIGSIGIAAFGLVGFLAALADPQHDAGSAAFAAIVGVSAGVIVLRLLLRAAAPLATSPRTAGYATDPDRRTFLRLAAGALVVSSAGALIGHRSPHVRNTSSGRGT